MINYKLINVLPDGLSENLTVKRDPGNIVISSIILFPSSKLTDEKNRVVELSLLRKRLRYNATKKRLFRNVDPPVSIVATNYPNLLLN